MSSFNIFGPATKKDIRVGYIDPDAGYVQNVSVLEANKYAALNPGTVFILTNRDRTRYLTINEVNALTPEDLNVDSNGCEGIQGLQPNERAPFTTKSGSGDSIETQSTSAYDDGCRGRLYLSGGGGVGAVGSPIFGRDGSLLAVRVISGGFGYRYEPKAKLVDTCKRGSGAVIRTVIGELPPTVEYFDQIEDFEIYDFTPDGTELSGYGDRFGPDGNNLGKWDPNLFATLAQDPIQVEIQKYQDFLSQGINPFWSTRKEKPLTVTFGDKTSRVIHQVTDKGYRERRKRLGIKDDFGWSDWMNKYAVSPAPESNAPGSDYAGRVATMEWEENFPYTGEYVFRGMADNVGKLYLDNELLIQTGRFGGLNARNIQPQDVLKKTIQEGVHKIKVDLLNYPFKETVRVKPPSNTGTSTEELLISYRGMSEGSGLRRESDTLVRIDDDIDGGFDENARFEIKSSTVNAKFSEDGRKILYSGSGKITIEMRYDDDPRVSGLAITDIEVGGTVWERDFSLRASGRGGSRNFKVYKEKGRVTKTINVTGVSSTPSEKSPAQQQSQKSIEAQSIGTIFSTVDFINKANRKLWRTNVYGRGGFLNDYGICPFNTNKPLDDNPYAGTHEIIWNNINFPVTGNYKIDVEVDDRVKLTIGDQVIEKNGFIGNSNKGTGKSSYTKFFNKGSYKVKAELYQKPGGRFAFDGSGKPKSNNITARFIKRDNNDYLKVDGSGSAEITFKLRTNDNPRVSGVFASEIRIGIPPNDFIELKRSRTGSRIKEKELITGSAIFEAGREYLVRSVGSSSSTGSILKNNGATIQYDDDIDNGFDENADLSITRIKNQQPSFIKGVNPMALAINIEAAEVELTRVSPKSFNENPMGAAFTIDAPLPPIPQEPVPIAEGRCPKNPIWSTRFPGGQKKWWPVNHPAWSKFTNRFALSPLPPLSTLNSDGGGGIIYDNTWTLDIPYDGFYGIKGTADNAGRILIDNQEVYKLKGFKNPSPKIETVRLTEGKHTIKVEVENFRQENSKTIKKKIFSTQDWIKPTTTVDSLSTSELLISYRGMSASSGLLRTSDTLVRIDDDIAKGFDENARFEIKSSNVNARFSQDGKKLLYDGSGKITIEMRYDDDPRVSGLAITDIEVGGTVWERDFSLRSSGRGGSESFKVYKERGRVTKTITVKGSSKSSVRTGVESGKNISGVTYSGPPLFNHNNKNWSDFMNRNNVSPFLPPLDLPNPNLAGDKTFTWTNVDFPESGRYEIKFQSDFVGRLFINNQEIVESRSFRGEAISRFAEVSAGKYEVTVVLLDDTGFGLTFNTNPTGFALKIFKDIEVVISTPPWTTNPLCASAVLIPPPCPKIIEGQGVVTDIIPLEPGNGYPSTPSSGPPVTLVLKDIIPTAPGINYGPDDLIFIDGKPVTPRFGPFGQIEGIEPVSYYGFTDYPNITLPSDTGLGFRGRPVFEPVIVPELVLPDDQLLQVTDLVGLKQTGYVNGKPYYGSTFSKDGILYAGIYETTGDLVQVYATLQESIDGQVTTRASAILRQGTDITSNDPRLDIPNTPDNLI